MLGVGRGPLPGTESAVARSSRGDPAERDAWVVLASVDGLGPVGFAALLRRFGDGRTVLDAATRPEGIGLLSAAVAGRGALDRAVVDAIAAAANDQARILDIVRSLDLAVLTSDDPAYPPRLLAVEMPPHVIFVRGDPAALVPRHAVAVVGTRRPSDHGRRIASRIAAAIADAGATIVSGLAVGIDGAAHAAAVAVRGPTVAVLGGGHGRLFPRVHARLTDEIVANGGAVVSELFPTVAPTRWTFPRRNRVVSGLADATVVVEAPMRSGALITASWALEQGRDCYLVPGPLDARTSAGSLAFLREHAGVAGIVASVPDLIDDLGLVAANADGPRAVGHVELGPVERLLVDALARGASTTDDLVRAARQPVATVLGAITMLEMRGFIAGAYGRYHLCGRLAGAEVA
jgi:DNA processing protein